MNSFVVVFVDSKKKKLKKIIEENNIKNSPLCIGLISAIVELCTPIQNMVKMQHGVMELL